MDYLEAATAATLTLAAKLLADDTPLEVDEVAPIETTITFDDGATFEDGTTFA